MRPPYAAYERLVAPARLRPALWRLVLGALLVAGIWAAWSVAVIVGSGLALGGGGPAIQEEMAAGDTPRSSLVLLATFLGLLAAPFLAAWLLHARRPPRLIGPRRQAARDFGAAFAVMAALFAATLVPWSLAYDSAPGLPPAEWALLLPLTALLLLAQTGAEEVFFRGYLQSQLAARFASPLAWAVLPSLAFGAVHWDASAPAWNAGALVGSAALFGLIAADLTARTGTLGAAWGVHFANNLGAIAVLATPGTLSGLALRRAPYGADAPLPPMLVLADLALLVLAWAVLARLLGGRAIATGTPAP